MKSQIDTGALEHKEENVKLLTVSCKKVVLILLAALFMLIMAGSVSATTWTYQAENLYHLIGRADGDGWSANIAQDSSGFLCYGPYTTDPSGVCQASFKLMIDAHVGANDVVATVDVFDATAGIALATRNISRNEFSADNTYQYFRIGFNAPAGHQFEFRTQWYDNAYIKEDCVVVNTVVLPTIYYFDVTYASGQTASQRYDTYHTAVSIQGLANRNAPRVFLKYWPYGNGGGDAEWLNRLREPGGLCENWSVDTITDMNDYVDTFRPFINGLVVYDADPLTGVISTSLAATTAAACENAIAVRKDTSVGSMYNWLVNTKGIPVLIDLSGKFTGSGTIWGTTVQSTGSKKCDAYIWAKVNYLDNGRCNPTVLSYTLDMWGLRQSADHYSQLSNLDYAMAKKGFCFELSPWGDEIATDDPGQPLGTDLNTMKTILNACNVRTGGSKMIKLCGFPNWDQKYTNASGGTHDPVATEWEFIRILSAYNTYAEADAPDPRCVTNASFYAALEPAVYNRRYVQNPPPTYTDMRNRGLISSTGTIPNGNYIMLGLGDYDAASWTLYSLANDKFNDANRGQRYCNWAVDPNLTDRASVALDYMFRHKTAKDYFMSWDSGAGYLWLQQLYGTRSPSGYGSAVPIWQAFCKNYYGMFDYSISGWLLNGSSQITTTDYANYAPFSGDGIGSYQAAAATSLTSNVPCNRMKGDLGMFDASDAVMSSTGLNFGWYRTILWYPSDVITLENKYTNSGRNHKFLDAFTYYYLLRYSLSGRLQSSNYYRATWVGDTIPRIMAAGQTYPVAVSVRNDGWDTWTEASLYRMAHAVVLAGTQPTTTNYDANPRHYLPTGASVAPGQTVTFLYNITAPAAVGTYDLYYTMVKDGVTWFQTQNNLECKRQLIVAATETSVDTDGDGIPDVTENANGTLYWDADSY